MTGSNQPLVSVIMPYYNGRAFMREAVQSLLNQTYPNIEIIVVDDASPSKEDKEYIEQLADELGFTLIKHDVNKGIGQTLADAVEASHGSFITELSQDDFYKPQKIEKQLDELTNKKLDAVYAAGDILYQDTGETEIRDTAKIKKIVDSGDAAKSLRFQNLDCISIQGLLAGRQIFENDIVPIWRDYLLDDWPVNIHLFERYRVGFIAEPLWTGRGHANNTSRNIWKWFGPQIEVVARMAPPDYKTEAVGGRLISMARRIYKENGSKEDIIRLALAGLMLTESPKERQRAIGITDKMPYRNKKTVTSSKLELFKSAKRPVVEKTGLDNIENIGWDDIGKKIASIVSTYEKDKRLDGIGRAFLSLAHTVLRENQSSEIVVRITMAALALIGNGADEMRAIKILHAIPLDGKESLINKKCRDLRAGSRFSLRSLIFR